jgi:ABC-type uncharacterized transport system substrate-binding protein
MNSRKEGFLYYSLIGNAVLGIFVGFFLINNSDKWPLYGMAGSQSRKRVCIAIMFPAASSMTDAIIKGFKEECAQEPGIKPFYHLYDHGGDRQVLHAQIEDVIQKDFDLIFTIGQTTSSMVAELTRRRGCHIPVVFAAVQDPIQIGIVPRERDRSCFVTGSSSDPTEQHEQRFSLLLLLKPDIQRLLIPYYSGCDVVTQRKIANVATFMEGRGILVKKIEISSIKDCVESIAACIKEGDVIWIGRDSIIVSNTRSIAQLARRHRAIVYASSADAIEEGVPFAFAADDKGSGYNAGKKAREVLAHGKHPSEVPITSAPCNYSLWVKESLLESYGIKISVDFIRSFLEI